jgi:outer membrane lipoprotein-sorting protein
MSSKMKKWIPAVVAPATVVALSIAVPMQANAEIDLPDKTASEILQMMNTEPDMSFSGRVTKVSNLGLPPIGNMPDVSESMVEEMEENTPEGMEEFIPRVTESNVATDLLEIISGTHEARIYVDGPDKLRVQILDPMSERSITVNGDTVWFYDDDKLAAQYMTMDMDKEELEAKVEEFEAENSEEIEQRIAELPFDINNPAEVADYVLEEAGEYSDITVGVDQNVAGREAYELIATPLAAETTVDYVSVAIDAETGMALNVKVLAKGQVEPAMEIGFTSIDYSTPAASIFEFNPSSDVTVTEMEMPEEFTIDGETYTKEELQAELESKKPTEAEYEELKAEYEAMENKPELYENGWASVVEMTLGDEMPVEMFESELFSDMTEQVDGGQVISTPLVNVLITDDGRVLAGAVTTDYLLEIAG